MRRHRVRVYGFGGSAVGCPGCAKTSSFLRDPVRLLAILILVACGAAIVVWIVARGDLVGADARAYWGGVRLWLGGGDPLDPPPPYMPYVYWSWSLPLFTPWAALPWETAWFVYRAFNIIIFVWSVWPGPIASTPWPRPSWC